MGSFRHTIVLNPGKHCLGDCESRISLLLLSMLLLLAYRLKAQQRAQEQMSTLDAPPFMRTEEDWQTIGKNYGSRRLMRASHLGASHTSGPLGCISAFATFSNGSFMAGNLSCVSSLEASKPSVWAAM